jgi:acetyltransferase-like isoleucine patch superfamily enzyme
MSSLSMYYKVFSFLAQSKQFLRMFKLKLLGYRNISRSSIIESDVLLDKVNKRGVHIGSGSLIAARSVILSHEHVYRDKTDPELPFNIDTVVGKRVFVGVGAMILPGAVINDDCVIGAYSVVRGEIQAGSLVVGNPGKVVRTGLKLDQNARIITSKKI